MCIVEIHQPIAFQHFEHWPITDKWAEHMTSVQAQEETHSFEETRVAREKSSFCDWGVFQANDSQEMFFFYMAYLRSSLPILKVNYFLQLRSGF